MLPRGEKKGTGLICRNGPEGASHKLVPSPFSHAVLIAAYGVSLLGISFALHPDRTLTHHEVMFAQPAREMLATGDWLVPRNLGEPCLHKPPGLNWLMAGAMAATGSDSEVVARIPSALAGVAAALLVAWIGARFFGRRVGLIAGLVQLTTYLGLRLSRVAEAEILLAAMVCAAMACFAAGAVESPRGRSPARWLPWLFYLATGLSFLVKALVGPVFVFGACGLYAVWCAACERDWQPLRFLASPVGALLFLIPVLGWATPAFIRCPAYLDAQVLHHFGRMQGEQGGGRDPFFYLYSIPFVLLPWTPFVIGGLVLAIRRCREHPLLATAWNKQCSPAQPGNASARQWHANSFSSFGRFTICWILPGLAVLCLSVFKRDHYLAPLVPPLAVYGAVGLVAFAFRQSHRGHRDFAMGVVGIVLACAAGLVAVLVLQPPGCVELAAVAGLLLVGMSITIWFEYFHSPAAHLAGTFATTWLVAVVVLGLVLEHYDSYSLEAEFARRVNDRVPAGKTLYLVELHENQIFYYLEGKLHRVQDPQQLPRRLPADQSELYLVAGEQTGRRQSALGRLEVLDQCPNDRWYLKGRGRLTLFRLCRRSTACESRTERDSVHEGHNNAAACVQEGRSATPSYVAARAALGGVP